MYKEHTVSQSIDSVQIENVGTRGANSRCSITPCAGSRQIPIITTVFPFSSVQKSQEALINSYIK